MQECDSLNKIVFPSTLKKIGNNSFSKCPKIENIDLPNNLEYIGEYVFSGLNSLTGDILIPNTEEVRTIVEKYNFEINQWFLDNYKVSLYISSGYSECSSNSLKNTPEGSYAEIFKNISKKISEQKASRYTAEQIINLNKIREKDYSRECRICKNVSK